MAEQTHVYGEGYVLGIPGRFANATVLVDASGNVKSIALGSPHVENEPVEEVKDIAPEQEQPVAVVEEEVPPVQIVTGG